MTANTPRAPLTPRRLIQSPDVPRGGLPPPREFTVLLGLMLYLLAFGRWGSHVSPPGAPVFITDVLVTVAAIQTVRVLRRRGTRLDDLKHAARTAHLAALLAGVFLAWVLIRALLGIGEMVDEPLSALRDLAPYAYAGVALLAFLLPSAAESPRLRGLVYGAFAVHLAWVLGAPFLPGWPGSWPTLGNLAIFTPRPDFDSAVFGVAAALALHDLLGSPRLEASRRTVYLGLTLLGNGFALADSPTRAGLLSGLVCVGTVLTVSAVRPRTDSRRGPRWSGRGVAMLLISVVLLLGAAWLSPPGQRLVESVSGKQTAATGTLEARRYTWSGVTRYVLSDARRTAVGVGFGPDFVTDSGTSFALEGTEYKDVRSPHNYLIGTFARLGMAGALLASGVLIASAALAVQTLTRRPGTVTALAALMALALPVTALLGVILESPFGAVPYFWAVGHLCRSRWEPTRRAGSASSVLPVPPVRTLEPVAEPDLGLPAKRVDP